jgi:hypothetical protein
VLQYQTVRNPQSIRPGFRTLTALEHRAVLPCHNHLLASNRGIIKSLVELQRRGMTMVLADNLPISRCLCCGDIMKLVRTVPGAGGLPGLVVVTCSACNEVEVKEERRAA